MIHSTFVPIARIADLLTHLYAAYKGFALAEIPASRPLAILNELRAELGDSEYDAFESDMSRLLKKVAAWHAVATIIASAIRRKMAMRSALGSRHRIIESFNTKESFNNRLENTHGS
ncbi:MAG: hypothetical protein LAO20_16715 [Acidobacteriia bacterium]|nr:hypothetical protein [Terriglobia bacterium]